MWDILRGADWNAHSRLSYAEIPGFSQSCLLKTECWALGHVGTLFSSSFNTPFRHRLFSREIFSPHLLFSFWNEVQCSLHPATTKNRLFRETMRMTGKKERKNEENANRQMNNRSRNDQMKRKDKCSVIKRLVSFRTDLAASMNRTFWILVFFVVNVHMTSTSTVYM